MHEKDDERRDYFRRIDPLRADNADDVELAFQLQHTNQMDADLLRRIIDSYSGELYRWIRVLLYYQKGADPTHEAIYAVMQSVLSKASNHLEQFHGQSSVLTWLIAISYQIVIIRHLKGWVHLKLRKKPYQAGEPAQIGTIGWDSIEQLSERQRNPLLLRYLFDLELSDIAIVLNWQRRDVHLQQVAGIERLFAGTTTPDIDVRVLAYTNGFWGDDPDALNQFEQHLETCEVCKSALSALASLEKSLSESLKSHWGMKRLEPSEVDALINSILTQNQQSKGVWKPSVKLGQVAWMLGLLAVFVVLAVIFIRLTPVQREFPQTQATVAPPLPPVIDMQPLTVSTPGSSLITEPPQFIIPAFSSDAEWAVFTAIKVDPLTVSDVQPTIQLFDRRMNSTKVISEITGTIQLPWAYWVLAPSISGDGQRVVYVTSTVDPQIAGSPCEINGKLACLDIFLYDRLTGSTRRLTQSWNGGAADGSSLAPSISADGQVVAFWSQADNLVEGDSTACLQDVSGPSCLYIYLYNLQTNRIERIPHVNIRSDVVPGIDRISLSNDGRYVGFTVSPAPELGKILPSGMKNNQAIIYDQQTSNFELENQAQDGTPGNGPSSSPVLSADGRYVAFTSAASNLVIGDNNQHSDVFVRDRTNGEVELVSVASDGTQGNDNSGLTYWTSSVYSLNMSGDGRYVVFESSATNLAQDSSAGCSGEGINICNLMYVRDRQTRKTDLVIALSNQDYSFFPGISADGHWLTFMRPYYDCNSAQTLCSNVMIFDRNIGEITNLTIYNKGLMSFPWTYAKSLTYPLSGSSLHLALSPDGKLLALADDADARIRLWNLPNEINSINPDHPDEILSTGTQGIWTAMAIAHNDGWLAASTDTGSIYLWNLSDKTLLYAQRDQVGGVDRIAFSKDNSQLIIFNGNETRILDIDTDKLVEEGNFITGPIAMYSYDISPGGDLLATSRPDGTVWVQSLPSGKVIARLGGYVPSANILAFSPDGSLLAVRSPGGRIDLWKIDMGKDNTLSFTLISSIITNSFAGKLAFSPDNQYLASAGWQLTLWSLPAGNEFTLDSSVPNGLGNTADIAWAGDVLAALTYNGIVLWGR